jgi:hypothetical protein
VLPVLHNTLPIVKFIKARLLNSRLLKLICNDMRNEYQTFTSHTKFCWLSRVMFHMSVCQLKMKLQFFFFLQKEHH